MPLFFFIDGELTMNSRNRDFVLAPNKLGLDQRKLISVVLGDLYREGLLPIWIPWYRVVTLVWPRLNGLLEQHPAILRPDKITKSNLMTCWWYLKLADTDGTPLLAPWAPRTSPPGYVILRTRSSRPFTPEVVIDPGLFDRPLVTQYAVPANNRENNGETNDLVDALSRLETLHGTVMQAMTNMTGVYAQAKRLAGGNRVSEAVPAGVCKPAGFTVKFDYGN